MVSFGNYPCRHRNTIALKIELAHDSIARKVYERASASDRMRLRVLNLVRVKHQMFENEQHQVNRSWFNRWFQKTDNYLTKDEVKTVRSFEEQLQLSPSERTFLIRSRLMARRREIIVLLGIFAIMLFLLIALLYYVRTKNLLEEQNIQLEIQDRELQKTNLSLIAQNEELRLKDSISNSLESRLEDNAQIIRMTNEELQEALTKLRIANKALEESKLALERERDKLREDKRDLTQQLSQQVRIVRESVQTKAELTALEQSQKLSQQAQTVLQSRATPSEAQYKQAFRLARHAWELSPKNSQAMDILNVIGNNKLNTNGNGGFLERDRPKVTYTRSKIQQIIDSVDRKYNYGKLPEEEVRRVLRR